MDMSNMLANIGAGVLEARKRAHVHGITASDGMEYCAECGEPLLLALNFSGAIAEKLGKTLEITNEWDDGVNGCGDNSLCVLLGNICSCCNGIDQFSFVHV